MFRIQRKGGIRGLSVHGKKRLLGKEGDQKFIEGKEGKFYVESEG